MPIDSSIRRVSSRQNPLVARCRALARDGAASEVLLEGATLVGEALDAGWTVEVVAFTDDALASPATSRLAHALPEGAECLLVTAAVMDAMSPVRSPSGVVAIARAPSLPHVGTDPNPGTDPALVVCAIDVQDPGNLGAMLRVAEAAGASGVMIAGQSADPWGWKALRGAMGSAFRVPTLRRLTVEDALARARTAGWQVVATVLDGTPLETVDLATPTALFVGAEGAGLPAAVIGAADVRLTIPMAPPVESLNVAVAAAIVLYEARRQRRSAIGAARRA